MSSAADVWVLHELLILDADLDAAVNGEVRLSCHSAMHRICHRSVVPGTEDVPREWCPRWCTAGLMTGVA